MKSKLIMVGLVLILAMSLMGCLEPVGKEVHAMISIDEFMSQKHVSQLAEVNPGDTLVVTLGSNPSTGFSWQPAVISDDTVLKQEGESEFVPPAEAIPGAGGKEVWTFKVLKKGEATVSLEYSRPWEGGEQAEWTYTMTVIVD